MPSRGQDFFVITGGPGSGKSTLLDRLEQDGFARSTEAGRGIVQDQMAIGGSALPWDDKVLFAELMLCWEMRSHRLATQHAAIGPILFDRGVPDIIGMSTPRNQGGSSLRAGVPIIDASRCLITGVRWENETALQL